MFCLFFAHLFTGVNFDDKHISIFLHMQHSRCVDVLIYTQHTDLMHI